MGSGGGRRCRLGIPAANVTELIAGRCCWPSDWLVGMPRLIGTAGRLLAHADGTPVQTLIQSIPVAGPHGLARSERAKARGSGRRVATGPVLDEFLAGPENQLATAIWDQLLGGDPSQPFDLESQRPTSWLDFSPLVLYGPTGVGKSHLAQGLADALEARSGRSLRVQRDTAEQLTADYGKSVVGKGRPIAPRYENLDLWVIEDLEHLAGHAATSLFACRVMDELAATGGRVVATANLCPTVIDDLLSQLATRLSSGLLLRLAPPEFDTRRALVQAMAELLGVRFESEATQYLAEQIPADGHRLLQAVSDLADWIPGRTTRNKRDVEKYLTARPAKRPSLSQIATQTARFYGLKVADLRGTSRRKSVAEARGVAMLLARELTGQSFERIGKYFGKREHATVMHACRKTAAAEKSSPAATARVLLRERLTGEAD